jgi:hypothetical protein
MKSCGVTSSPRKMHSLEFWDDLFAVTSSPNIYEELVNEDIKRCNSKFVTEVLPVWNGCIQNNPLLPLKNLDQGVKVQNLCPMASAQSVVIEGYFNFV